MGRYWVRSVLDLAAWQLVALTRPILDPWGLPGLIGTSLALPVVLLALTSAARRLRTGTVASPRTASLPLNGRWLGLALSGLALFGVAPLVGVFSGCVGYSAVMLTASYWLNPAAPAEGPFGITVTVTGPVGAALGLVAAEAWALLLLGSRRGGGRVAAGGAGLLLLLELAAAIAYGGSWPARLVALSRLREIGAPLPATVALFLWGLFLLRPRRASRRTAPGSVPDDPSADGSGDGLYC